MHETIVIAKAFSDQPAGRYLTDGPDSGERFREEFLLPKLRDGVHLTIDLDGGTGYPSSFLEEAFGGLVRNYEFSAAQLRKLLIVRAKGAEYQRYIDAIWRHIDNADTAKKR